MILKLVGLVLPLRASARDESLGMDIVQHGEQAYTDGEGAILVRNEPSVEMPLALTDA